MGEVAVVNRMGGPGRTYEKVICEKRCEEERW